MNDNLKGNNTVNHNIDLLYQFNLSDKNSLKIFNGSTRDITNLNVLKCIKSGVIVLEKFVIPEEYYEKLFTTLMSLKEILKQLKV